MKQFRNKDEMEKWFRAKEAQAIDSSKNEEDLLKAFMGCAISTDEYVKMLIEEGYVDLNNLTANGEGYEIGGYTNNGWIK